uniref:Alpha-1,4 glucan phosphorylase n=1 Tax=Leptobrachium leishanense TaxID=445787 RepID=A0A8C5PF13_9ANUR
MLKWAKDAEEENLFIFGNNAKKYNDQVPELCQVMYPFRIWSFSPREPDLFKDLVNMLMQGFNVFSDYEAYISCQQTVDPSYMNLTDWTKKVIRNIACSGKVILPPITPRD